MSSSCSSIPSSTQTATTSSDSPSTEQETHHLLWSRSRVYVHPTPYSRDNVPGYLALVRKGPSTPRATIYLSYLPEALLQERDEVDKFVKVEKRRGAGAGAKGKERAAQSDAIADDIGDEDVQVTAVDVWDPGESVREKGSWKRGRVRLLIQSVEQRGSEIRLRRSINANFFSFLFLFYLLSSPETLLKTPSESGFSVNSKRSTTSTTSPTSYAVSIPLSQLHSLRICPPSILEVGSWHGTVNINTINGLSLPTLYFHDDESSTMREGDSTSYSSSNGVSDQVARLPSGSYPPPLPPRPSSTPTWGGDELLRETKKYSNVLRSVLDLKLFLIDPSRVDYEAHTTPLFDDDAIDPTLPNKSKSSSSSYVSPNLNSSSQFSTLYPDDPFSQTRIQHHSQPQASDGTSMDPFTIWAKSTKMSVLTQFSHLTQHARKASSNLLAHPLVRPHLIPGPVQSFAQAGPEPLGGPSDLEWKEISNKSGLGEYDSARVYLAKWSRLVAEEGERNRRKEEGLMAENNGFQKQNEGGELGVFEVLGKLQSSGLAKDKIKSSRISDSEISEQEWKLFFDGETGRPLLSFRELKSRIFSRGLEFNVRSLAWPFLLGALPFDSTTQERETLLETKKQEYERFKKSWKDREAQLLVEDESFKEQKHRVKVDCLRTDRGLEMFKNVELTELEKEEWRNRIRKEGDEEEEEDGPRPKTNPNISKLENILITYGFWDQEISKASHAQTLALAQAQAQESGEDTGSIERKDEEIKVSSTASTQEKLEAKLSLPSLDGYVQGMSDLCSPLFVVFGGDESLTFWCFTGMMNRMVSLASWSFIRS